MEVVQRTHWSWHLDRGYQMYQPGEESRTGKGMEHQKSLRTTNLSQVEGEKSTNM